MTILSSAFLGPQDIAEAATSANPVKPTADIHRVQAFEDALGRQSAEPPQAPPVAPASGAQQNTQTANPGGENTPEARERARRALGLDGAAKPAEGDAILNGLHKLRGVFDASQQRVTAVMQKPAADVNMLMEMQWEVSKFTMLIDVASKLTGKATQSFDTLMKGQ